MVVLAALATVLGLGVASAAGQMVQTSAWRFTVGGLKDGAEFTVRYDNGEGLYGEAEVFTGTLETVAFSTNGFQLSAFGTHQLSGLFTQGITVEGASLTGVATVPNGTLAMLKNLVTSDVISLKSGPFSIPTGVGLVGSRPPTGGTRTIRCNGDATSCTAIVPLAGGARNRRLLIKLTDANLRLLSDTAVPRRSNGTYQLTRGHLSRGHSVYVVTLNAIKSNPKGSHVLLKFGAAA